MCEWVYLNEVCGNFPVGDGTNLHISSGFNSNSYFTLNNRNNECLCVMPAENGNCSPFWEIYGYVRTSTKKILFFTQRKTK